MHKFRYGIGERYGKSFVSMSREERQHYANAQQQRSFPAICPWRSSSRGKMNCNKKGGVCSLRLFRQDSDTMETSIVEGSEGIIRTTCPNRFYESNLVFEWIGETILGHNRPIVLNEIQFLERVKQSSDTKHEKSGCRLNRPYFSAS
jgi:hypothetical protein